MEALLFGLSLGFVSGIGPGPLMTLVLSSTLERGFRAGALTAVAPLLTDAPIVLLCLLVLRQVPEGFLHAITVAGGAFIVWVGVQTIRGARHPASQGEETGGARDLLRGAVVNVLNPHPWLFWATVGAPFLIESWSAAPWRAVLFLGPFYGLLVGCKVVIAWLVDRGRQVLASRWYRRLLVGSGGLLVALGVVLLAQGLRATLT